MGLQSVDRPPLIEWGFWPETISRWQREGLPRDIEVVEFFGFDKWRGAGCLEHDIKVDLGPIPRFEERIIEETENYRIRQDQMGVIVKEIKGFTSMPQFLDFPVKDKHSWEGMKERLNPRDPRRYPLILNDAKKVEDINNRDYPLILSGCGSFFGWIRNMVGLENLLLLYYDDPKLIHDIGDYYEYLILTAQAELVNKIKFDCVNFWEDMAWKRGPLISPIMFREFVLPHYQQAVKFFKEAGVDIIAVDSDGNIEELIPLWLEVEVTVFHPMEVAAGMDVRKLGDKYGSQIGFWGNIDKRILAASKEDIYREVTGKVPIFLKKGGFVPFVDHHVPPDIPLENYLYYQNLLRNLYGMPNLVP